MANLLDAIFFTVLVASAGLGITYIITAFFPSTVSGNVSKAEANYENVFFGTTGVVIALLMWLALVF